MRILHCGPFKIGTANGSYNALWSLAKAQARLGHDVTIIRIGKSVHPDQSRIAEQANVRLVGFPCHRWWNFWKDSSGIFASYVEEFKPDIAHLQYVRVPKYFYISRYLREKKTPYVVSLHGGMNSTEMRRNHWRKMVYWHLVEKKVHQGAAALHFVTKEEMSDYYRTFRINHEHDASIFNTVEPPENIPHWQQKISSGRISFAYFGRYDIWHKGIDLVFELLRILQNNFGIKAEFHLYGSPGNRFVETFSQLCAQYPDIEISDHGFVDGIKKFQSMVGYDFYIQYSRFELFGISMVEAMQCGVPILVSENCDLAKHILEKDAAIVLSMEPGQSATVLNTLLANPRVIAERAARGKAWAITTFSADKIAEEMFQFYERVVE